MQINFSIILQDAFGKPIVTREGSEETYTLGDAVVDALNFSGRVDPRTGAPLVPRTEEEKRKRWKLVLRLTQPAERVEDSAKYPTLLVGKEPALTHEDITLMQRALHERFDSPMIYAQAYDLLSEGTGV